MAAFLLAPLAAGPIVGPLFSLYLRLSVDSEQFRVDKFLQGALSFGFAVTIVAYLATLLGGAMTLWYAHKNRIVPSFWFTVVTGLVGGTVVVESNPWVWFLQGDVGSQLFFLYAGLGALSGHRRCTLLGDCASVEDGNSCRLTRYLDSSVKKKNRAFKKSSR